MGLPRGRALAVIVAAIVVAIGVFVVFRPGDQASAGVDLGDPHAWVEHGIDGELLQINSLTGEVTARIDVAKPGESFSAVPHADGAVVLNSDANSISLVSGQLLSVTSTVPLAGADATAPTNSTSEETESDDETESDSGEMVVFGSSDLAGNVVVVSDTAIVSVDPQTSTTTPIVLPAPLRSILQDEEGNVTALSPESEEVLQLGAGGLTGLADLVDPVGDTGDQRSLVRAGTGTFVVDPSRLSISEVQSDGTFGLPFCTTSAVTGAITGGSGAGDEPVVLAYNPITSTLNVSRPGSGCSDIAIDADVGEFGAPVATGGFAYLPNWTLGRIIVVDLEDERVAANFPFGTRGIPFELDVVGSTVWANERQGPFAAVVDAESITPVAKISTIVAGSSTDIDGEGEGSSLTGGADEPGGLLIIGETGDSVIAPGADAPAGDGVGNGPEAGDVFSVTAPPEAIEPSAIGIAIDPPVSDPEAEPETASPEAEPVTDEPAEQVAEIAETLVANFSVSAGTATEGEVLRFTDSSSGSPVSWTWDFGDGTGAQEPNVEKAWDTEGIYVVSLVVTNAAGAESTQLAEITVVAEEVLLAPAADFSFDRNTIEAGESVLLTSRTTGDVDLLEWDFGDGESSVGPTAEHTYDDAGIYTVTLTASNAAGSSSTSTKITVLSGVDPPTAAIAPIPKTVVQGQFVALESVSLNEPTRLAWDFGDGNTGAGTSTKHAWAEPGTYRIRLTAENSEGSDETFTDIVVTKRIDPPVSQFTQSATEVLLGENVTFTNLSLNDPTKLIWDFGDDTTARGETTTKSWSQPGRYRVTLRATNDAGTNRTGVTITVVRPVDPPTASFDAGTTVVATKTRVNFRDTSGNNPTSWSWNFGDTGVSSNPNTSHEWAKPGTYVVRLTVANEGGSSTAQREIVVKDLPSANFRWEIVEGTTVKFTDTSWDGPTSYSWDFGDGATSTERSPTHTFTGGVFDVKLVVSNDVGASSPKVQQVTTVRAPVARPVCEADGPRLICSGETSARANGFTWAAPDAIANSTPNQSTTILTFPAAGRYDVTLTVSNIAGATDAKTIKGPRVTAGRPPRVIGVAVASIEGDLVRLKANFDRGPTAWAWTVEGAQLVEGGDGPEPLFRVPANGVYTGTVQVSNEFGTDTDPVRFRANGLVTEASFTWQVIEPGVVQFTNTSQARPDAEYEWRFAGAPEVLDGNPAGPTVRYRDAGGTFRAVLLVTDANGNSVYRENVVVPAVEPPPEDPPEEDE